MSSNDNAGRIHKEAFIASTIALLVLLLITTAARLYIRIRAQKRFCIDDGFLLFGIGCTISAMGILLHAISQMYAIEALLVEPSVVHYPISFSMLENAFDFQKWVSTIIILLWTCICSVKFSFLFFFRNLIERLPRMLIYWRVIVAFSFAVWAFGIVDNMLSCPYFHSLKALQCTQGSYVTRATAFNITLMALDILNDICILYIPVRIIWKAQIRWTQKAALSFSLCLTVVLIALSLVRASGLRANNAVDAVWETYWSFIVAEVGLILTSVTTFHTFFVTRNKRARQSPPSSAEAGTPSPPRLGRLLHLPSWRSETSAADGLQASRLGSVKALDLADLSNPSMTGVRTFISGQAPAKPDAARIPNRHEEDDLWPLSDHGTKTGRIRVQHEISSESEMVPSGHRCDASSAVAFPQPRRQASYETYHSEMSRLYV